MIKYSPNNLLFKPILGPKQKIDNLRHPRTGGGPAQPQITPTEELILQGIGGRPSMTGVGSFLDTDAATPEISVEQDLEEANTSREFSRSTPVTSGSNTTNTNPSEKFTQITADWPGSVHDSHIFKTSSICKRLEKNHKGLVDGVLLGDSGYMCRPFLLTPYNNPQESHQERFNGSHVSTRSLIERTFGVWKRRFHVLHSEEPIAKRVADQEILLPGTQDNIEDHLK
ncbi:HARBI1 [Mytilus edulis]|uniref:HARBI1 n=1 Tax=Mytilus edulis TaxID=6550 RepID=A0A8S3Q1X3_MYTED|nr:HARBI1 [Mytilus edulis]